MELSVNRRGRWMPSPNLEILWRCRPPLPTPNRAPSQRGNTDSRLKGSAMHHPLRTYRPTEPGRFRKTFPISTTLTGSLPSEPIQIRNPGQAITIQKSAIHARPAMFWVRIHTHSLIWGDCAIAYREQ